MYKYFNEISDYLHFGSRHRIVTFIFIALFLILSIYGMSYKIEDDEDRLINRIRVEPGRGWK